MVIPRFGAFGWMMQTRFMNKQALIIFVKNPELGKVKTRLAADVGDQRALEIYLSLLEHTMNVSKQASCDRYIFYSSHIDQNDLFSESSFHKLVQKQDPSLGERMLSAFEQVFNLGHEQVLIVGSDCLEISASLIDQAFEELSNSDCVIGPALDGGYYLLGLKELNSELFRNKSWSTESLLEETQQDLQRLHKTCKLLPKLSDIDTLDDLERLGGQ